MWREWLSSVAWSTAVSVITFWGIGGLVHWWFYVRRRDQAEQWKLQPRRFLTPDLMRHAMLLGGFNLALGSLLGGTFVMWVKHGGYSSLSFELGRWGWLWIAPSFVLSYFAIDAGLYYSHRALHHRALFPYIHRLHHRYVAPTVFTTTAMHPLEFFIFTSFLVLPAFVIPMHVGTYLAVIGWTYFIGVLDHSGVRFPWKLPLHDDGRFHDDHHIYVSCNYGHHTSLWDRLHGTAHA
jgi:lathosterol oxidase